MKQKLILTLLVTLIVSFVCWKNDFLNNLYQELTSPKKWRKVEIVDEQSTFEELMDYSWEYFEMVVVGLAGCVISFTIGWRANSIRKGYENFREGDLLAQCLGEHCALYRWMEKLEERVKELEQISYQDCSEEASDELSGGGERVCTKDEQILPECETSNKEDQIWFNDRYTVITPASDFKCPNPHPTRFQDMKMEDIRQSKIIELELSRDIIKARDEAAYEKMKERCDGDVRMIHDEIVNLYKTINKRNELLTLSSYSKQSHETSNKFMFSGKPNTSKDPPKEGIVMDDVEGSRSQNEKNCLDGDEVCEATTKNLTVKPSSTKINVLEAQNSETNSCLKARRTTPNQVKPEDSCGYNETENNLDDEAKAVSISQSDEDFILKPICDFLEFDLNSPSGVSTANIFGQMDEDADHFKLDASQSRMALVDGGSTKPDSARSASWKVSAGRITSRGRIPQYQKLHKESNSDPKTTTLNEKENKNVTRTEPCDHDDGLSMDESSSQRNGPQRQNRPSTASGDPSIAGQGQRKKKQRY